MENPTSVPEPLIIRTASEDHHHYVDYPLAVGGVGLSAAGLAGELGGGASAAVEGGAGSDDDSDKPSSANALNKNAFRCLLLLLPVAIPVVVYLKDIDATRRIFLTAFVLFLFVVFSCMLMALLRGRRTLSLHEDDTASNSEYARELTQRHIVAVTNRLLPRTFPSSRNCHFLHGDTVSFADVRRPHVFGGLRPSGAAPVHYQLAPVYSRSPSPRRPRPASPAHSECGRLLGASPSSVSPFHLDGIFRSSSQSNVGECCEIRLVRDDPPSYEEALNYPLASTVCGTTKSATTEGTSFIAETPPPTYDRVVK